jgi:hypothetical protein
LHVGRINEEHTGRVRNGVRDPSSSNHHLRDLGGLGQAVS